MADVFSGSTLEAWFRFFLTFVGAFALYIYSLNHGAKPMSIGAACTKDFGKTAKPWQILLDAVFTSLLGATIGYYVTVPITNAQAVAAGLGFVGLINSRGGK